MKSTSQRKALRPALAVALTAGIVASPIASAQAIAPNAVVAAHTGAAPASPVLTCGPGAPGGPGNSNPCPGGPDAGNGDRRGWPSWEEMYKQWLEWYKKWLERWFGPENPAPKPAPKPTPEPAPTVTDAPAPSPTTPAPTKTTTPPPAPKPTKTTTPPPAPRPTTPPPAPRPTTPPAPKPKPSNPNPPAPAPDVDAELAEVLRLTNAERAKTGAAALKLDDCLTKKAAQTWAEEMARTGNFKHQDLSGISAKCPGMSYVGENIAMGYPNAKVAMDGWMGSQGHKENILRGQYNVIGLGLATNSNGQKYWVQVFGRR